MRNAFSGPCLIALLTLALCHLDHSLALLELPKDYSDAIDEASCNNCDAARLQSGLQLRRQRLEHPKLPDATERLSISAIEHPSEERSFDGDNDNHQKVLNDVVNPTTDLKRSRHPMKTLRFQGLGKRTTQQNKVTGNAYQNRMGVNLRTQRRQLNPIYLLDEKALDREARNVHRVVNRHQKPRIAAGIRYTGIGKKRGVDGSTRNFGYQHRYYGVEKR